MRRAGDHDADASPAHKRAASRLVAAAVGALIGAPLYLLLIDIATSPELYAGLAAVLIAAWAYEAAYAQGYGDAAFHARWFRRTGRVLANVPVQIAWVCAQALVQLVAPRAQRGTVRAVRFHAGSEHDRHDLGRRALTEALGSLTPNTIVIGVDPAHDVLLVHQLRRAGGRDQLDQLGLG